MNTGKKVKYFLLAFTPLIVSIVWMFLISMLADLGIIAYCNINYPAEEVSGAYDSLVYSTQYNGITMLIYSATIILIMVSWYLRATQEGSAQRRNRRPLLNGKIAVSLALLTCSAQIVTDYLVYFVTMINPLWLYEYNAMMESAGLQQENTPLSMLVYSVLLAPVCEELIFRAMTMSYIKRVLPFWAANTFQALCFGFYHMNIMQGVYAFVVGILFGYVYEKGRRLHLAMLLHIMFNFYGTFLSTLVPGYSGSIWFLQGIVFAGAVFVIFVALHLFVRGVGSADSGAEP